MQFHYCIILTSFWLLACSKPAPKPLDSPPSSLLEAKDRVILTARLDSIPPKIENTPTALSPRSGAIVTTVRSRNFRFDIFRGVDVSALDLRNYLHEILSVEIGSQESSAYVPRTFALSRPGTGYIFYISISRTYGLQYKDLRSLIVSLLEMLPDRPFGMETAKEFFGNVKRVEDGLLCGSFLISTGRVE